MTFHRPPEISPAAIDLYLDSADVSAIWVLSAGQGGLTRFAYQRPPSKLPAEITLAGIYWFPGRTCGRLAAAEIVKLLVEGLFLWRKNSAWCEFHVEHAEKMVRTVAANLNLRCVEDKIVRERAEFQVRRVETDFERRLGAGEIRAVVGRNYRVGRKVAESRGEKWIPWQEHQRQMKLRAIRESAAIWGRAALFSERDARAEAGFVAAAEGLHGKVETGK